MSHRSKKNYTSILESAIESKRIDVVSALLREGKVDPTITSTQQVQGGWGQQATAKLLLLNLLECAGLTKLGYP